MNTINVLSSIKANGEMIDSHCLNGRYKELCDLIGYEATEKLYIRYYGEHLAFPKKFLADEFVHSYIVKCYNNGYKAKQMARDFDYTYSWILKIIRSSKRK